MRYDNYDKYNEAKQHGKPDFPIQLYCVVSNHPQYFMPLHRHKELEIIKVYSGTLNLYINNISYSLSTGDIAVINCKYLHRAEPDNCKYDCIVCDLDMMVNKSNEVYNEYIMPIIKGDLIINCLFQPDSTKLYSYLNSAFVLLRNEPKHFKLSVLSNLFGIFEQLYSNNYILQTEVSKKLSSKTHIITELLEWINNNYSEHINLEILSEKAGVTPNYLCRIFKSYTGKTPIEYVNYIRIQNICYDIKWKQKNITEIAMDNGYNDISYFCKVFKKHTGISAKKYSEMKN